MLKAQCRKKDQGLSPIQRVFFYMPLQHAESAKVQAKGCELFNKLAEAVSPTYRETFSDHGATFAELHRDIVDQFWPLPASQQALLGRENTPRRSRSTWLATLRLSARAKPDRLPVGGLVGAALAATGGGRG